MRKMDFIGMFLIISFLLGIGCIFLYSYPQKIVSKPLEVGIALRDSNCYQRLIAAGGFKNVYETRCRTMIKWEKEGEEIVELPFPLVMGERVTKCKITIYPYLLFPPRREIEYQRY